MSSKKNLLFFLCSFFFLEGLSFAGNILVYFSLNVAPSKSPQGDYTIKIFMKNGSFPFQYEKTRPDLQKIKWLAPREGVYDYQVTTGDSKQPIILGSFIVLDGDPYKTKAKLAWKRGALAPLYLIDRHCQGKSKRFKTRRGTIKIPRSPTPCLVVVTAKTSNIDHIKSLNASLTLLEDDPVYLDTLEKEPLSDLLLPQDKEAKKPVKSPLAKRHSLNIKTYTFVQKESYLATRRYYPSLSSGKFQTGKALAFDWTPFGRFFLLKGHIEFHNSRHLFDVKSTYEDGTKAAPLTLNTLREKKHLSLSFNVFSSIKKTPHSLFLGAGITESGWPRLPLSPLGIETHRPSIGVIKNYLVGADITYFYQKKNYRVGFEGSHHINIPSSINAFRLYYELSFMKRLQLGAGLFANLLQTKSCDSLAVLCRSLNRIKEERLGSLLSVGTVF